MEALILPAGNEIETREVAAADVARLWALEQRCFVADRLSQRRMRFYVNAAHAEFILAEQDGELLGYALLLLRRGTQLTRLYSIAVAPEARGKGIAQYLIDELQRRALERGKRFMRLEVAEDNDAAIRLYQRLGFSQFGIYPGYYANNANALRMQKVLSHPATYAPANAYPWYRQTTEFTCGPAALMMAMRALSANVDMSQTEELRLWRRATTIFMTSGHGGCHPLGLALAAVDEGFTASVWLNRQLPLFSDGVRSTHKKHIIEVVEADFAEQAEQKAVAIEYREWRIDDLVATLASGHTVVCLISTYQFDKRKAPHWVTITGIDERCVYIHDPDPENVDEHVECQHIPIAKDDFLRLASYGKRKIRTAVVIASSL